MAKRGITHILCSTVYLEMDVMFGVIFDVMLNMVV